MSDQDFNLGEILGRVMSDPALMASLKSTAQTLFGENGENSTGSEESTREGPIAVPKGTAPEPTMPSSPEKEEQSLSMPPTEHSKSEENEQRIRLLLALKPYMDEGRRGKIDTLLRIMNLMKLSELGGLLKGLM